MAFPEGGASEHLVTTPRDIRQFGIPAQTSDFIADLDSNAHFSENTQVGIGQFLNAVIKIPDVTCVYVIWCGEQPQRGPCLDFIVAIRQSANDDMGSVIMTAEGEFSRVEAFTGGRARHPDHVGFLLTYFHGVEPEEIPERSEAIKENFLKPVRDEITGEIIYEDVDVPYLLTRS